jgi:hypothetical protein
MERIMPQIFVETETLTITTSGGGTGNDTTDTIYNGAFYAYDVDYGTADGTTVLTFSVIGGAADDTDRTIAVSAAQNTDGMYLVRKATVKAADGTAGTGEELIPFTGRKIKVAAASAGSTKTITVRLILLQ